MRRNRLRGAAVWRAGLLTVLVAALLALAACGRGGQEAAVDGSTAPEVSDTEVLTMADWDGVLASPEGRENDLAENIVGKAFVIERGPDGTAVQMYTTPDLSDGNTIVYILDSASARSIREQDYLRVSGTLGPPFTGENAFGGEITAPVLVASEVKRIGAAQAVIAANPPVATKRLKVAADQSGMRVTVKRVDRLPSGGRVVVEAVNGTGSPASIYGTSASLVQGNRQHEAEYTDLPGFPSELQPGVRATVVIQFAELRPGPARLVLTWYSENFSILAEDFALTFRVP